MKITFFCMIMIAGQFNSHQGSPVVHLDPHRNFIKTEYGGTLLELINAPSLVLLPVVAPTTDAQGKPWCVDVKNLGPGSVTVADKDRFSTTVSMGQTDHICSNGQVYSLRR